MPHCKPGYRVTQELKNINNEAYIVMKNKVILLILDGLGYSYARKLRRLGRCWRSTPMERPICAALRVWPILFQHPYRAYATRPWCDQPDYFLFHSSTLDSLGHHYGFDSIEIDKNCYTIDAALGDFIPR